MSTLSAPFPSHLQHVPSRRHDALYYYFSRLVSPIWNHSICSVVNSNIVSDILLLSWLYVRLIDETRNDAFFHTHINEWVSVLTSVHRKLVHFFYVFIPFCSIAKFVRQCAYLKCTLVNCARIKMHHFYFHRVIVQLQWAMG